MYIYRSGAHYSLIEGYPKTLQEELGVQGPVDAAFTCPGDHTAHIIQGPHAHAHTRVHAHTHTHT